MMQSTSKKDSKQIKVHHLTPSYSLKAEILTQDKLDMKLNKVMNVDHKMYNWPSWEMTKQSKHDL